MGFECTILPPRDLGLDAVYDVLGETWEFLNSQTPITGAFHSLFRLSVQRRDIYSLQLGT